MKAEIAAKRKAERERRRREAEMKRQAEEQAREIQRKFDEEIASIKIQAASRGRQGRKRVTGAKDAAKAVGESIMGELFAGDGK